MPQKNHDCRGQSSAQYLHRMALCYQMLPYLLKSVTDDLSYEYLEFDDTLGRIPVGKTDFYGYRRKFYACLLKKKSIKSGDKSGTIRTHVRCTITSNDTDTGQRKISDTRNF